MRRTFGPLPYLLLLPGILLCLVVLYPFFTGVYWSFTRYDLTTGLPPQANGITNYTRLFSVTGDGLHAILITFLFAIGAVFLETSLGFGVALLLMRETTTIKVFRALIILPLLVPPVVATIMWKVSISCVALLPQRKECLTPLAGGL